MNQQMATNKKDKNWFKRHKILTVIGGFFVFCIVIGVAGGGKDTPSSSNGSTASSDSSTKATATMAKIGEAVKDGKFEFTVTSMDCGHASVGTDQYLSKTAQGQYCLLNMTVKNIGNEAQTLDGSSQVVYNAQNQKYSADSAAAFYVNPTNSTFLNQINPGNTVTGVVAFDIPKDQTPVTAELHDSSFSSGVKVSLQ